MPTLRWLGAAVDDLERLLAFLADKSPVAANSAAAAILDGTERLLATPRLGRLMPDGTGRRLFVIPFASGGYVLHYVIEPGETIVVLRIWHSREARR